MEILKMARNSKAERKRLFDLYAKQISLYEHDWPEMFICPICMRGLDRTALDGPVPAVSLAHVIPEKLGGKLCTLSCTECNNNNGHAIESYLCERLQQEDWATGLGTTSARLSGELLARVARPEAEINPLRQGFLLLMTAFDAAVFDLTRIAFKKRFFQIVGVFGGKDKWSLEEIGEAGSFEALRDRIIEEQLKKRYVKDLIGILEALGVSCVDTGTSDRVADLIELILRRNIHVHNRGVVDERYLEVDPRTGKGKFNLFNLKLGDVACIELIYLEGADRLCQNCVQRIAEWVDAE